MTANDAKYLVDTINKSLLVGATLISAKTDDTSEADYGIGECVLIFKLKDGREAEVGVLRDPEGNGPGWLSFSEDLEGGTHPSKDRPETVGASKVRTFSVYKYLDTAKENGIVGAVPDFLTSEYDLNRGEAMQVVQWWREDREKRGR